MLVIYSFTASFQKSCLTVFYVPTIVKGTAAYRFGCTPDTASPTDSLRQAQGTGVSYALTAVGFLLNPVSFLLAAVSYLPAGVSVLLNPVSVLLAGIGFLLTAVSYLPAGVSVLLNPVSFLLNPVSFLLNPVGFLLAVVSYVLNPVGYALAGFGARRLVPPPGAGRGAGHLRAWLVGRFPLGWLFFLSAIFFPKRMQ